MNKNHRGLRLTQYVIPAPRLAPFKRNPKDRSSQLPQIGPKCATRFRISGFREPWHALYFKNDPVYVDLHITKHIFYKYIVRCCAVNDVHDDGHCEHDPPTVHVGRKLVSVKRRATLQAGLEPVHMIVACVIELVLGYLKYVGASCQTGYSFVMRIAESPTQRCQPCCLLSLAAC